MGVEALSVINDHEDAISTLAAGLHKTQVDVAVNVTGAAALADEQRAYVDGRDRELRACCQERWDSTSSSLARAFAAIAAIDEWRDRGFLARLRWLFTGK